MTANGNKNMVVKEPTKDRLDRAKLVESETYDSVINRALDALQEKTAPKPAAVVP